MVKWIWFGRKRQSRNQGTTLALAWGSEENYEKPVRIACVQANRALPLHQPADINPSSNLVILMEAIFSTYLLIYLYLLEVLNLCLLNDEWIWESTALREISCVRWRQPDGCLTAMGNHYSPGQDFYAHTRRNVMGPRCGVRGSAASPLETLEPRTRKCSGVLGARPSE
jgi:hypothetical protein